MPTSAKLVEMLKADLPENKRKFSENASLRRFCDDYENEFGRPELVKSLEKIFKGHKAEVHLHDLLSRVPHFKTIVTTNYDKLLENSYGPKAHVIISNTDVHNVNRSKCKIFKIHGDIDRPESIVISENDYVKQHLRNFRDPFWSSFNSEIASNHIVFLGYGYDDENVKADFAHIESKLKSTDRKRILIIPNINSSKAKLLKNLNIDYVESDGERFINELILDIKDNIVNDHRLNKVDTQTAIDFITAFDCHVDFSANTLTNITKVTGITKNSFNFTTSDRGLIEAYNNFKRGYDLKELVVPFEKVSKFKYKIEDFTFFTQDELGEIKLQRFPKYEGNCKIKFVDKNVLVKGVKLLVYSDIPGKAQVEGEIKGFKFTLQLNFTDHKNGGVQVNFTTSEPEKPQFVGQTYEAMQAFYFLFSGERFKLYVDNYEPFDFHLSSEPQADSFKYFLKIFQTLKKLESIYRIRFPKIKINQISTEYQALINMFSDLINNGCYIVKNPRGVLFQQSNSSRILINALKKPLPNSIYVRFNTDADNEIDLFGKKLVLFKTQIIMKEPIVEILNSDPVQARVVPIDKIVIFKYENFEMVDSTETSN